MIRYQFILGIFLSLLWIVGASAEEPSVRRAVGKLRPKESTGERVVRSIVTEPTQKPIATPDSLLRQAERMVSWKAYGRAIDIYTQLLVNPYRPISNSQRIKATLGLANTYRLVGDSQKAEKHYREWLDLVPAADRRPQPILQFAQVLASNGKFRESDDQYEQYNQLVADQQARRIAEGTSEAGQRSRSNQPVQYRLEKLGINTKNEEFSPMYFRDGLVYVAGSKGGSAIETTGSGGGSGYLDLFYLPSRSDIPVTLVINPDGSETKPDKASSKPKNRTKIEGRGRPTSNDSPIISGYDLGLRASEGLGYDTRPVNPVQKFSKSLNTRYHEGPATFSADGSRIIFTRNNYNDGRTRKSSEGVNKLKLYTGEQQNGAWINVEELPFNSDEYSVGHPTLSRDGITLYFASDMPGGQGGSDIYVVQRINNRWGKPVNLGPTVNTKGNELFPFVDENGNLYFSSDGRRGLGGLDVFMATMVGISPQSVEHLNAPLNSPQDDFGLITDGNRQSGYFSTNRFDKSDDILRFARQSSLYGCRDLTIRVYDVDTDMPLDSTVIDIKARTEGTPDQQLITDQNGLIRICLPTDSDFRLLASHDEYVSSNVGFSTRALTDDQPSRLELGLAKPEVIMDTIFTAKPGSPAEVATLTRSRIRGIVAGDNDQKPIEGVTVSLRNECDKTMSSVLTGPDGRYTFELDEGCDYTLIISKPAYGTSTSRIKKLPKKSKPKLVAADVRLFKVGEVLQLDNIYYDLDKISIRADASRELDKVVRWMRQYPSLAIEVRSHTDSRGDATYNRELSASRAKSVANYLISKGIARRRISSRGMGESQLLNSCTDGVICTEEEHQRNRRTEIKVISVK